MWRATWGNLSLIQVHVFHHHSSSPPSQTLLSPSISECTLCCYVREICIHSLFPQGQALVVAALATAVSIIFGRDLEVTHMLLLGASSMSTASIASAALGSIMIAVIVMSYVIRINPDNVATPIAASLGDLVTLGLLSITARWLYTISGEPSNTMYCLTLNLTLSLDNSM